MKFTPHKREPSPKGKRGKREWAYQITILDSKNDIIVSYLAPKRSTKAIRKALKRCAPDEENAPYTIMTARLGWKHASVHTKLPTDGKITVVGYDPENSVMMYHMAETVRNEYSEHACSIKLVGKANTKALAENWRPRSGWHRAAFFGDWSEEIGKLATLLGMKVEREDQ